MKKLFTLIPGLCFALFLCSCASFEVTRNLEEALAGVEDSIVYQDRDYMEKQPLKVPDGFNTRRLGNLNFLFAFDRGNKNSRNGFNANYLSEDEFSAFKREFENAIAGSRRFPAAQIRHGLADKKLREETRSGGNAAAELDASEFKQPDGILHLTPMLSQSESLVGKEKTVTNTFYLTCNPLNPKNNAPLDDIQSFPVRVEGKIYQLTDRFGRAVAGFRFNTSRQLEDYHLRQGRAAIVRFFEKMYQMFPVGGKVTEIDEDGNVSVLASRSTGLQPNMECVVFAVKKGNPDGAKIALYNATTSSVGQSGASTLTIWRKSDKDRARKIIKMIEDDFESAVEEYDIYACSSGFAQWPDFVEKQNTVKK